MSVLLTLGLLLAAHRLAAQMKRTGTLPADHTRSLTIAHYPQYGN